MLFNSYEFIFLLLPVAVIGDRLLQGVYTARVLWLLACSLFFYAWWNPLYLPLLLATMAVNFWIGQQLLATPKKGLLALGIAANLCLLGYFKYAEFIVDNAVWISGQGLEMPHIVLPLAISFFTFQQIAFLVDCYSGRAQRYRPAEYGLFVSFFPQLIAGPIVHHSEMMPQISSRSRPNDLDLAVGSTIFFIGLFKKAVLADSIAPIANNLFDSPGAWSTVTFFHAWMGVLAYSFQIYFDFSGYSDMAIGAARMFGIKLPLNFSAPYRAASISDFWRRWHMTLSRFLRDYLYIPLGGNRYGAATRYRNLMITMVLGGLWHGAGWTFVIWGLLHGLYLVVQQVWSSRTKSFARWKISMSYRLLACTFTFLAVNFAWTYFRANSLESANRIIEGLVGMNGVAVPAALAQRLGDAHSWLPVIGIQTDSTSGTQFLTGALWIAVLAVIVWALPTTQDFMKRFEPAFEFATLSPSPNVPSDGVGFSLPLVWQPSNYWAVLMGGVVVVGILSLPEVSEFLYFQF